MHVRNECSNFLFEAMEATLKRIKRLRFAVFVSVIRVVVVRACVWAVRVMLLSFSISRRRFLMGGCYIVFAHETLDIFLSVADATRELRGLKDNILAYVRTIEIEAIPLLSGSRESCQALSRASS
jgi:hypothetical protein